MNDYLRKGTKKGWGRSAIFALFIISLTILCVSLGWAAEEPYPSRPITVIIHMAPGGVESTQWQLLGDRLASVLGQPIIPEFKPGAGGIVGASFAAKAKPDGYTLYKGTSSSITVPLIIKKVKVDYSWEDFSPIAIYARGQIRLYVRADSKWKTVQDFVKEAKERHLKVSTWGIGTYGDFAIQMLSKLAGIKVGIVPYKNCGESMTALLGGHVDADCCTSSLGQVQAGAARILAVAEEERSEFLPDVMTFKECGYPVVLPGYSGLMVPKRTPQRIVDILDHAMQEVFRKYGKEIQEGMIRMEWVPYFLDSKGAMREYKKDYETIYGAAKEYGFLGKYE
jgi:tripartite-type tricarboxylate transporter receptor subunit TctC